MRCLFAVAFVLSAAACFPNDLRANAEREEITKVRWSYGAPHPTYPHVVSDWDEGWWATAPGYRWAAGQARRSPRRSGELKTLHEVTWWPSTVHPDHSHLVAGAEEDRWIPAAGYRRANPENGGITQVRWSHDDPHPVHPHVVSDWDEGWWATAPGYRWAAGQAQRSPRRTGELADWQVKWAPGQVHPRQKHILAASREGQWQPAAGYKWITPGPATRLDDREVQWAVSSPHPDFKNVVASNTEARWQPADGFRWGDGGDGIRSVPSDAIWAPGYSTASAPGVVGSSSVGMFVPANGYVWIQGPKTGKFIGSRGMIDAAGLADCRAGWHPGRPHDLIDELKAGPRPDSWVATKDYEIVNDHGRKQDSISTADVMKSFWKIYRGTKKLAKNPVKHPLEVLVRSEKAGCPPPGMYNEDYQPGCDLFAVEVMDDFCQKNPDFFGCDAWRQKFRKNSNRLKWEKEQEKQRRPIPDRPKRPDLVPYDSNKPQAWHDRWTRPRHEPRSSPGPPVRSTPRRSPGPWRDRYEFPRS